LAATHIIIALSRFLFDLSGATRVRVPVAGIILVFALPIIGAVLGGLAGWRLDARNPIGRVRQFLDNASMFDRAWIAWGAVWTGAILIAFTMFDPFHRYSLYNWRAEDMMRVALIWVGPIVAGWIASHLVRWVASGHHRH
jgi:hypothetical protein